MSDERRDETLDACIDEAARGLTASPAPDDLRRRVLARIHAPEQRPRPWLVPVAATALALMTIAFLWTRSPRDSSFGARAGTTTADLARSENVRGASAVASGVSNGPTDTVPADALRSESSASPAETTGAASSSDLPPSGDPADVELVEAPPPDGIEPIVIAEQWLEPLPADELSPMASIDPEPIPMESIQLAALGTQEGEL